jgi:DNA repair exonuclease SbcCD ATPase subunit
MMRSATVAALLAALVAAIANLAACGAAPQRAHTGGAVPSAAQESGVGVYLDTMNRLANGNPAQQADIFYEVERDYTSAPTTASTLRYGAALVTAGHPAANLVEGKKLLERLLANAERLTPAEKSLAAFLVKDADARLQLQAEVRRLAATVDERARGQANLGTRLQSQVQAQGEEIARLRKQLEDAQQKLDAIKSMEKSFIERGSSPPPPSRP